MRERLNAVFCHWDRNGDGVLDKEEIDAVLERLESAYDVIYDSGDHHAPGGGEGDEGGEGGEGEQKEQKGGYGNGKGGGGREEGETVHNFIVARANKAMEVRLL